MPITKASSTIIQAEAYSTLVQARRAWQQHHLHARLWKYLPALEYQRHLYRTGRYQDDEPLPNPHEE